MSQTNEQAYKRFIIMMAGCFMLVLGITMILTYWQDIVAFFKAVTGIALAVGGLVVLYSMNKK